MKLKDTFGNTYEINLPKDVESVSLAKGLGFRLMAQNIDDWLTKKINDETLDQDRNYYLYMMAEAINYFTDFDLNSILAWKATDLLDEKGQLYDKVLKSHLTTEVVEKSEGIEDMLLYIFGRINTVLDQYKFKFKEGDFTFKHKGVEYKIPGLIKSHLLGKKVFDEISIGQSVDIMKTKKYISMVKGYQEDMENKRNIVFTSYLKIISMIALPVGKNYPTSPEKAESFVQSQAVEFQDIDYCTANDIVFFLTNFGDLSKEILTTNIISTLLIMRSLTNRKSVMKLLGTEEVTTQ